MSDFWETLKNLLNSHAKATAQSYIKYQKYEYFDHRLIASDRG